MMIIFLFFLTKSADFLYILKKTPSKVCLLYQNRPIECSNGEFGYLLDLFNKHDSIKLIIEDSGLIVPFDDIINFSKLSIYSSNEENKTIILHSTTKKYYPTKIDINELLLNNTNLIYTTAQGNGNFIVRKKVTVEEGSMIQGVIQEKVNSKSSFKGKIILKSMKSQQQFKYIHNGIFKMKPVHLSSKFEKRHLNVLTLRIYQTIFGFGTFILFFSLFLWNKSEKPKIFENYHL
jgi:hypothetical protein